VFDRAGTISRYPHGYTKETTNMALVIPDGYAQVAFVLRLTGDPEPMITTIGMRLFSTEVSLNDYALAFGNDFTAAGSVKTIIGNAYSLERVDVRANIGGSIELGTHAFNVPMTGSAGTLVPQNSAFLVHKRGSLPGRRHRGRMYLPGIPEAAVDDKGLLLAGNLATYNAALASFLNLILSDTVETASPYVLHSQAVGAPAPPPPTLITSLQIDPVIATQRRRLRR
jgi:hypothetical protein